ncbi:hypothetical protein DFH07DRAFT_854181 [Mycena maculata]|uniref:Uncharacterized protein n=1 Tax=Mycena maculata TaxID=230809 RepID=A0AAD7MNB4_9AGAR|nr:hypothetical protein DFH07DRAFT_854181 [Mycena maculata]
MAANIVLPPLRTWAEQHLSAIIKATSQAAFESAFDGFLSKNATVTVNGKHVSREQYKQQLQGEGFDEAGAFVTFGGAVEVPADQTNPIQAGVVGLFYTATISENIVIRDAPVQSQITSSLNLVIEEDKSLTPPHTPPGVRGFFDGRRVSVLNQIILDARSN